MNHVQRQAEKEGRREAMEAARVWGVSPWMFQPILRQSVRKWLLLSVRILLLILKRAQGLYGNYRMTASQRMGNGDVHEFEAITEVSQRSLVRCRTSWACS